MLRSARIFEFPGRAHEVCDPASWTPDTGDNFALPFKTIAVEDTASCVILRDKESGQIGRDLRVFIECAPLDPSRDEEYGDSEALRESIRQFRHDVPEIDRAFLITVGAIGIGSKENQALGAKDGLGAWDGLLRYACAISREDGILMELHGEPEMTRIAIRNAAAAIDEVLYFDNPDFFVVEEAPARPATLKKRGPKILRSHQRPKYTSLKPRQIRDRLGLSPHKQGGPTAPHERRAHWRTFRSERYSEKVRGKRIRIASTWVGPSEVVVGGRKYRVILD